MQRQPSEFGSAIRYELIRLGARTGGWNSCLLQPVSGDDQAKMKYGKIRLRILLKIRRSVASNDPQVCRFQGLKETV
jgi:hypothetical protein